MTETSATALPLTGIKVLDISRVLAGPMTGMILGDLGADVTKVEHPERGDDTRDWGLSIGGRDTTYYYSVNRNKRSVTLDLQSPEGQEIARKLAGQADVIIQNFKAGGAEKLGLGYEDLIKENPRLIYCTISGYDRTGSERSRPGYDLVIQGESGMMAINGEADRPPLKFGVAAADLMTGMYAAQAVLAALYERSRTGRGRHVEMALFDCGLTIPAYNALDALKLGKDPARYGNNHPSIVPYGVFEAADGPLVIAVGTNAQFRAFCAKVIDRRDIAEDPRFATNMQRIEHRKYITSEIINEVKARNRSALLAALEENGIPCGLVNTLHEALTSERVKQGGLVTTFDHPIAGTSQVLSPPYRFDGVRAKVRLRPPMLGEHTASILEDALALSAEDIDGLKSRKIV
jgi:crotonobetainyl-CoA:carnitine CoA-transferase CaiB-like acyl-CoA transferase